MKYDPKIHHRRSIRLNNYDYSQPGLYYVTICTKDRQKFFGEIKDQKIILSEIGKIADKYWREIPRHYPNIELDEHIIMPNHVHGIIGIIDAGTQDVGENVGTKNVGAQDFVPLQDENQYVNKFQHIVPKSLGSIIRGYKIGVKRWCNENGRNHFEWQKGYYDHIIRNEKSLNNIREYIFNNPRNWEIDRNNPKNIRNDNRNPKSPVGI